MRKLFYLLLIFLGLNLYSIKVMPFNFTVVPYLNLLPEADTTILATGFISSNVRGINGVQAGPVFSTTTSDMTGVQASGVFNIVEGNIKGLQTAGVFNINTGEILGIQTSGVFNISEKDLKGIQAAGVFNIVDGDVMGLQASGVFNICNNVNNSLQVAGVFNIADDFYGAQVAGAFNIAERVKGTQIGVVNVANKTKGVQIGVVNVTYGKSNNAIPIGVLNFYNDGIMDVFAYGDFNNNFYYGIETGSKHFYTQLYLGHKDEEYDNINNYIVGYGLGLRPFKAFDIVLGAKNYMNRCEYQNYPTPSGKASLSLDLGAVSIFGGIQGDFSIDNYNDESDFFHGKNSYEIESGVIVFYNYFVGVKLHL